MRKLNRTETPEVKAINNIEFFQPAKIKMPNGIPLEIIDVGEIGRASCRERV